MASPLNAQELHTLIISLFIESILYGTFFVLCAFSVYVLQKHENKRIKATYITLSIVMFILGTIHAITILSMTIIFLRSVDTLVSESEIGPGLAIWEKYSILSAVQNTAYGLQTFVGDGIMLHRLYIIWQDKRAVVATILLLYVFTIGAAMGDFGVKILLYASNDSNKGKINLDILDNVMTTAFWGLSFITNFGCTGLIALRLWWTHRRMLSADRDIMVTGRSLVSIATVMVELGAIYSICLFTILCLNLVQTTRSAGSTSLVLFPLIQIIGIVFMILNIYVYVNRSRQTSSGHGERTVSRLRFMPSPQLNGSPISTCSSREPVNKLHEHFPPRLED